MAVNCGKSGVGGNSSSGDMVIMVKVDGSSGGGSGSGNGSVNPLGAPKSLPMLTSS